jgi:hypothetical protein
MAKTTSPSPLGIATLGLGLCGRHRRAGGTFCDNGLPFGVTMMIRAFQDRSLRCWRLGFTV